MCGCFVALAAFISPRLAIFFVWLLDDQRMAAAFSSFWIALLGFLLLPWTTLAWAAAYAPRSGVTGFGWVLVAFAFVCDLGTHFGSAQARRGRDQAVTA